jgi:hypothetical protein
MPWSPAGSSRHMRGERMMLKLDKMILIKAIIDPAAV